MVGWFAIAAAWYGKKESDITQAALKTTIDAERNSVRPFIKLDYLGYYSQPHQPDSFIIYTNIGKGPALNLYRSLPGSNPRYLTTALGAGEEQRLVIDILDIGEVPFIIEYDDIYGRHFESWLTMKQEDNVYKADDFTHREVSPQNPRDYIS